MKTKVKFYYSGAILGNLTIIEVEDELDKKVIVFDCGSGSWNFQDNKLITELSTEKLKSVFESLENIQPNIIIISHSHEDHYNLISKFDLDKLEKVICYKADSLEEKLRKEQYPDKKDMIINWKKDNQVKRTLSELEGLTDKEYYRNIFLYTVDCVENNKLKIEIDENEKENSVGLVCVVHQEQGKNNIFLPSDSSPAFWTKDIMSELEDCTYIMLPHHGDCNIENKSILNIRMKNNLLLIGSPGRDFNEKQIEFICQLASKDAMIAIHHGVRKSATNKDCIELLSKKVKKVLIYANNHSRQTNIDLSRGTTYYSPNDISAWNPSKIIVCIQEQEFIDAVKNETSVVTIVSTDEIEYSSDKLYYVF